MRIYAGDRVCGFRFTNAKWSAFSNFQPLAVPIAAGRWTFSMPFRRQAHAEAVARHHLPGRHRRIHEPARQRPREVGHLAVGVGHGVFGAVGVDERAVEAVVAHRAPFPPEEHFQPALPGSRSDCRDWHIVAEDEAQGAIRGRRLLRLHHPRRALARSRPRTVAVGIPRPHVRGRVQSRVSERHGCPAH